MRTKKYNLNSPVNGSHEENNLKRVYKCREVCVSVRGRKISLAHYKRYRSQSKITKMEKQTYVCVYMMLFPAFGGSRDVER